MLSNVAWCKTFCASGWHGAHLRLFCTYLLTDLLTVSLFTALLQLGALAAFGAGSKNDPYKVITNPSEYSQYFGQAFHPSENPVSAPYLGWCFWMAVVGDMLSVVTGVLFLLAACCRCCSKDNDV